ncbi:MAG: hypothetical protein WA160_13400 [Pseudobdellovibrio sp.]
MRIFLVAAALLLSMNAKAIVTVAAIDYTCAELKALVKANGELNITNRLGEYTIYPNGVECFKQGMPSKFETMKAKDKMCFVGHSCDPYFGP